MIAEAIDRIQALAEIQTEEIDGEIYIKKGQGVERLPKPGQVKPVPLLFSTLTSLAQYYEANIDNLETDRLAFHVEGFNHVRLIGPMDPSNDNLRFTYAEAIAEVTPFCFGKYMDLEDFVVCLQTQFATDPPHDDSDVDAITSKLSEVAVEHVQTHKDDNFAQSIQIRTGLAFKTQVKVENPVRVYPWRTFAEIQQPLTPAVLRFLPSSGQPKAGLFEAGGAWKSMAMLRVKEWLSGRLPGVKVLA